MVLLALLFLLKTSGLKQNGNVISNAAFTFGIVSSAIEHTGDEGVYIESGFTITSWMSRI